MSGRLTVIGLGPGNADQVTPEATSAVAEAEFFYGYKPYVDRLMAAEGLVVVHPVWNYGFPAILKGYFDRVFMPGVSFVLEGGDGPDKGKLKPNLKHIKKVAFVTSYGGDRWRTFIMGDPPRRFARRWGWVTFGGWLPPTYLALYDMNNVTPADLEAFKQRVRRTMARF